VLAAACLGGLLYSIVAMAHRVAAYNAQADRKLWVFQEVKTREFRFAGRDVSLTDSRAPDGSDLLTVKYGDKELKLVPSIKPRDARLPGLARHSDWLRVLRFAEYGKRSAEEFKAHLDEGTDRIVVATRRAPTGPDPRTGDVWRRDWTFDFHELMPDGMIHSESLRTPKTKGDKAPKADELKQGTWEMEAALLLMPGTPPDSLNISRPAAAFKGDAVPAMGWTLPTAAATALGFLAFAALAAAPRRK
jgi:hypothetical protein